MRILIGYDGSDVAKDAILALGRAGLPADTEAHVISVADVWPALPHSSSKPTGAAHGSTESPTRRKIRALTEQALVDARRFAEEGERLCHAEFPGWKVTHAALTGTPYLALVEPTEGQPDLIVVGPQGRSGLERFMLGSVSQSVLTHASCSVHISRRSDNAAPGANAPVRIVLGIDGSVHSALALGAIAARPWPAGTQVKVVTAMDLRFRSLIAEPESSAWAFSWAAMGGIAEDGQSWAEQAVHGVEEELRSLGLAVSSSIREGDPKKVLIQEAREWAADCIFVGAKGHSKLSRLMLGSVSAALAARAPCSVEVVRQGS
jgi:nucleotide-binding universal stress UspA family protein